MYRNILVTLKRMSLVPWHILNKRAGAEGRQGFEQGILHRMGQDFRVAVKIKLY